jgi:hypothetical protein
MFPNAYLFMYKLYEKMVLSRVDLKTIFCHESVKCRLVRADRRVQDGNFTDEW